MGVYILLPAILFAGQLFFHLLVKTGCLKQQNYPKCWLIYACLILSLLSGFRAFSIGTDTGGYVNTFVLNDVGELRRYEWFFSFITRFIRLFTLNPTIYLCIISLMINGLVIMSIYKMSPQPFVSVYCYVWFYFFFSTFNGMRQYLAISFLLMAFYYAKEKKWIQYAALLILAVGCHQTAILGIAFVLVPFIEKDDPRDRIVRGRIISLLKMIGMILLVVFGLKLFITILVTILPRYRGYLKRADLMAPGGINRLVTYCGLYLIFIITCNPCTKEYRLFEYPLCIAAAISVIILKMNIAGRLIWYFDIFMIFVVAHIWTHNCFHKKLQIFLRGGICTVGYVYMIYFLSTNQHCVVPYAMAF